MFAECLNGWMKFLVRFVVVMFNKFDSALDVCSTEFAQNSLWMWCSIKSLLGFFQCSRCVVAPNCDLCVFFFEFSRLHQKFEFREKIAENQFLRWNRCMRPKKTLSLPAKIGKNARPMHFIRCRIILVGMNSEDDSRRTQILVFLLFSSAMCALLHG